MVEQPARLVQDQEQPPAPPLAALLFAAPACTTPLWGDAGFEAVLSGLKDRPVDGRVQALAKSRQLEVECVREVLAVMERGPVADRAAALAALAERAGGDGPLVPPLVLLNGVFEVQLDRGAQLSVQADVAETLAPGDDAVKEAADRARAAQAAAHDDFTFDSGLQQLRDALEAAGGSVDRAMALAAELLQRSRSHARHEVFGSEQLSAAFDLGDGESPLPSYLSPEHALQLPLVARFDAKALVEVHPPQDQASLTRCALRVVALARIVDDEHWKRGQWPVYGGSALG